MKAQTPIQLDAVQIVTEKYSLTQTGKKVQRLDSSFINQFKMNSIADAIGSNSSVFIKSYGLGASSSTSFRGGNASQTAILWNGVNIQNAMLGQNDLSILPSFLFDQVDIEYGGSSSLWGSGAVAGSIHLNNELTFNRGNKIVLMSNGGSFGLNSQAFSQILSNKKLISSTKLYHINSVNNYNYYKDVDGLQKSQKLIDGNYNFNGLLQEINWQAKTNHILHLKIWLNDNSRKIPNYTNSPSKAKQFDKANRIALDWLYDKNSFHAKLKACYLKDELNYIDSLSNIFSNNKIHTVVIEQQNYFLSAGHVFQFGVNYTNNLAYANNYSEAKSLQKLACLFGDQFDFFKNKIRMNLNARIEKFNTGNTPLTGNLSVDYKIIEPLVFSINLSKVYRQPSLNELYWTPGGNVNLKPEEGFTDESNLKYSCKSNKIFFESNLSAFNRIINNWILWTPGSNGNPSPLNIQKVWSRGLETSFKMHFKFQKFSCGFQTNTSYVLSTVVSNAQVNSNVEAKQLIYTPRYNFNGHVFFNYRLVSLYYFQQYLGYRFTTSDNTQWLDPYHISSVKLSVAINKNALGVQLFFACNNLLNTNYAIIANRSMPFRNYEFGLTIQTSKNKSE